MRILITGATGFIGSALVAALRKNGHQIVACVHRGGESRLPTGVEIEQVDYMRDTDESIWRPRLIGIDVVINAVGILRETRHAQFDALHHLAPRALFNACSSAGVKRVIQISALGADDEATSRYHRSKKAADDALRASTLDWTIVQPSVVFGIDGASTQLFLRMASLPLTPLVASGDQRMQPIHIDDLCAFVMKLIDQPLGIRQTIAAVGPQPVTMRDMLSIYRAGMGLGPLRTLGTPLPLMRLASRVGDVIHAGALSTETLEMLLRGNTASARSISLILGHAPHALNEFIPAQQARTLQLQALESWLRPLMLISIAAMWIGAGAVSWLFARAEGIALLEKLGLSLALATPAFIAACALNLGLGIATLAKPGRSLWLLQLAVMTFYTGALSWVAPSLWADPFGSLIKNLPIAALLIGLAVTESRR